MAEYFGACVERVYDVGVSGLHRLLARLDTIQRANCVIAVAGMEGALLTMINSCANGISVVNIDNGYGAGYIAAQINRLGLRGRQEEEKE